MFEFLSSLDTTTLFLLLIIFVLFVLSMKKVFSLLMNAIWIAIASVAFPLVMNKLLGWDIPIDTDSLLSFVLLGLGVYFVYLFARSLYKVLGMLEKQAKKVPVSKLRGEGKSEPEEKYEPQGDKKEQKELKEKEKELAKKEQELNWREHLEKNKKPAKEWHKDYVELKDESKHKERDEEELDKDEEEAKGRPRSSYITPLPVIKKKKK